MAFLIVLLVVVAVVVLVLRAASVPGAGDGGLRPPRQQRRRPADQGRPLAPDDDPEFLRDLSRRIRRDDGSPA